MSSSEDVTIPSKRPHMRRIRETGEADCVCFGTSVTFRCDSKQRFAGADFTRLMRVPLFWFIIFILSLSSDDWFWYRSDSEIG